MVVVSSRESSRSRRCGWFEIGAYRSLRRPVISTCMRMSSTKRVKELAADPTQAFPGPGVMKPEQAEIERLRREVQKLKAERDILKKAAAYFAKDHT